MYYKKKKKKSRTLKYTSTIINTKDKSKFPLVLLYKTELFKQVYQQKKIFTQLIYFCQFQAIHFL